MRWLSTFWIICLFDLGSYGQEDTLWTARWLFDGQDLHTGYAVVVKGNRIQQVGSYASLRRAGLTEKNLGEATLMPGMMEGHAHLLLHPYNETSWNDQVLKESLAERVVRAVGHARTTLMAGFTTVRDLGSEGAGYADVGLKQSIDKGLIPGPRLLVAGPAIVATGSYGPKGFADHVDVPLGAEEADGDRLISVVRDQIGKGVDFIKVYADYRWGPQGEARPTFTLTELKTMVDVAASSGRVVVAHASTEEGMRRAAEAGVASIEHGDDGNREVYKLMREKQVALCPTLGAVEALAHYGGWKKGLDQDTERIKTKKRAFREALEAGVSILPGGDVGVFAHGDNVYELELMAEYGMSNLQVLRSVTSGSAQILGLKELGQLKTGFVADMIAVKGNPLADLSALKKVVLVMKDGQVYK